MISVEFIIEAHKDTRGRDRWVGNYVRVLPKRKETDVSEMSETFHSYNFLYAMPSDDYLQLVFLQVPVTISDIIVIKFFAGFHFQRNP